VTAKLLMTADEIQRDRAKWLEARKGTIGSSDIGVLLGLAPHSHGTPFSLFVEKQTGESLPLDDEETARGQDMEAFVAKDFATLRPDLLVFPAGMYEDGDCPWMTASFDRFTVPRDLLAGREPLAHVHEDEFAALLAPAELKTALSRNDQSTGQRVWGEPGTAEIPAYIAAQAYWQMAVWGGDTVYVPMKNMGTWKTELYVVHRTSEVQDDIEFIVSRAAKFLDRIERDDPPPIDWTPETARALRTLHPLEGGTAYQCTLAEAKRLKAAKQRAEAAKQRYRLLQNKLAAKAAGAQKIVIPDPERDGETVTVMARRQYGAKTFEKARLQQENPDLAARYTKTSPVDAWWPGQRWMGQDDDKEGATA
jgi:putative phage-type endonuclease